jgi:hypothetical protein
VEASAPEGAAVHAQDRDIELAGTANGWDGGQLLLLDLGSDWMPPDPANLCW